MTDFIPNHLVLLWHCELPQLLVPVHVIEVEVIQAFVKDRLINLVGLLQDK